MKKYVTVNGKEIVTEIDRKTSLHKIKFTTGGELPQALQGLFTSQALAEQSIVLYINKDTQKHGTTKSRKAV